MSATRDTEQNTKFIFSNFYHLYLQSKAAKASMTPADPVKGMVLQTRSLTETPVPAQVHVVSSHGHESLKKWVNTDVSQGRDSMASQIQNLRNARKRLNYLMQEIDEILKRD